jgi:thiosulfate/3-mercaptopyruvate sulfurtransferase
MTDGHIKPVSELEQVFSDLTIQDDQRLIFSCGSGVTACILLLAAHQLGLRNVSVYDGSWTEWGSSLHLPIEI